MPDLTPDMFEVALKSAVEDREFQSHGEIATEIRQAYLRLKACPSLLRGEAIGGFTYSDPILSQILWATRTFVTKQPSVLQAAALPGGNLRSNTKFWGLWFVVALKTFKSRNHPSFKVLATRIPKKPLRIDKEILRVAVLGDAGYRGVAQDRVLEMLMRRHRDRPFDVVVHLGDIYFAAGAEEVLEHFMTPFSDIRNTGARVYSLVGNHDLYYGATAYDHLLKLLQQPGRYFAIETPHWKIACLDTSLFDNSLARQHGALDDGQLQWLRELLRKKPLIPTILMSHHYYISGWEPGGEVLRAQLEQTLKDGAFAWYWGHEHRCATYDRGERGFYGACVGNGAFIEAWSKPSHPGPGVPSWYASGRCKCYKKNDNNRHWPHGFLEMELHPSAIHETYHLEDGPHYERTLRR
jgi:Calcineurin-like phosphoesterase